MLPPLPSFLVPREGPRLSGIVLDFLSRCGVMPDGALLGRFPTTPVCGATPDTSQAPARQSRLQPRHSLRSELDEERESDDGAGGSIVSATLTPTNFENVRVLTVGTSGPGDADTMYLVSGIVDFNLAKINTELQLPFDVAMVIPDTEEEGPFDLSFIIPRDGVTTPVESGGKHLDVSHFRDAIAEVFIVETKPENSSYGYTIWSIHDVACTECPRAGEGDRTASDRVQVTLKVAGKLPGSYAPARLGFHASILVSQKGSRAP